MKKKMSKYIRNPCWLYMRFSATWSSLFSCIAYWAYCCIIFAQMTLPITLLALLNLALLSLIWVSHCQVLHLWVLLACVFHGWTCGLHEGPLHNTGASGESNLTPCFETSYQINMESRFVFLNKQCKKDIKRITWSTISPSPNWSMNNLMRNFRNTATRVGVMPQVQWPCLVWGGE